MSTAVEQPKKGLARIAEAAEFLSVSKSFLYKAIEAQNVPVRRIGNSLRVPWVWLEKQAQLDPEEN
jgi:excisionase family DNA binding protein